MMTIRNPTTRDNKVLQYKQTNTDERIVLQLSESNSIIMLDDRESIVARDATIVFQVIDESYCNLLRTFEHGFKILLLQFYFSAIVQILNIIIFLPFTCVSAWSHCKPTTLPLLQVLNPVFHSPLLTVILSFTAFSYMSFITQSIYLRLKILYLF